MEKYVQYLLSDIRSAADYVPDLPISADEDFDYLPAEEEEKFAPHRPLGERLRVDPEWFPPAARLTDSQMEGILLALDECLESFGFFAIFPDKVPVPKRYELLTRKLTAEVPILQHNVWQIEFCDFEPFSCPFDPDHCRCREFEAMLNQEGMLEDEPEEDFDAAELGWDSGVSDDDEDYLESGLDISGYDMPELFFGTDRFELWSEDEIDLHRRPRTGDGAGEDERSSDQFANPDFDPEDEEGEE